MPRGDMLIDAVDQRAVEIEDDSRSFQAGSIRRDGLKVKMPSNIYRCVFIVALWAKKWGPPITVPKRMQRLR
jgi:hypothetical protein